MAEPMSRSSSTEVNTGSDTETKTSKNQDGSNNFVKAISKDQGLLSKSYVEEYLESTSNQLRSTQCSTDAKVHFAALARDIQTIEHTLASTSTSGGCSAQKSEVVPVTESTENGPKHPRK